MENIYHFLKSIDIDITEYNSIFVLYHSNCADGISSATVMRDALRDSIVPVLYFPVSYGPSFVKTFDKYLAPNIDSNTLVIAVDLSLTQDNIDQLSSICSRLVEIDHHAKTGVLLSDNRYSVTTWPDHVVATCGNTTVCYSGNMCGAVLCWYLVFGGDIPEYLKYVDDYDRWLWKQPGSAFVNAAIYVELNGLSPDYPITDDVASHQSAVHTLLDKASCLLHDFDASSLMATGRAHKAQESILVKSAARNASLIDLTMPDGTTLPVMAVNSSAFPSEIGNVLATTEHPGATYKLTKYGWQFSLRGHADNPLDLNVVAMTFKGGGHAKASGFSVPFSSFDGRTVSRSS